MTWTEFCEWLKGKRVVDEHTDGACTELTFSDSTRARLTSAESEGQPYYSEVTPGCSGDLIPPTVEVFES